MKPASPSWTTPIGGIPAHPYPWPIQNLTLQSIFHYDMPAMAL